MHVDACVGISLKINSVKVFFVVAGDVTAWHNRKSKAFKAQLLNQDIFSSLISYSSVHTYMLPLPLEN